jgi:hypothetical protein
VLTLEFGEAVEDLLLERRVVDGLAVWRGVDGDDVPGRVTAVGRVGGQRGVDRLAALVVETTLRDV